MTLVKEKEMKISLDKEIVKNILIQEEFYTKVPEYYFLKEAGYKILTEMSREGGCSACSERNLIEPTVSAFISHTVNLLFDCGPEALVNFKNFARLLMDGGDDFQIGVFYKDNDDAEIQELLI
jgi:hypothetical protein